jgi:hypothetical protein
MTFSSNRYQCGTVISSRMTLHRMTLGLIVLGKITGGRMAFT